MSFEAKFHGTCGDCGGHIAPGDRAQYEGHGEARRIVHEVCPDGAVAELRADEVVCTECFTVKPCPCDDGQGPVAA